MAEDFYGLFYKQARWPEIHPSGDWILLYEDRDWEYNRRKDDGETHVRFFGGGGRTIPCIYKNKNTANGALNAVIKQGSIGYLSFQQNACKFKIFTLVMEVKDAKRKGTVLHRQREFDAGDEGYEIKSRRGKQKHKR